MSTGKSTVQYDKAKLYSITNKLRGHSRYKVINRTTHNNIRKIKLNRRGCRGFKDEITPRHHEPKSFRP